MESLLRAAKGVASVICIGSEITNLSFFSPNDKAPFGAKMSPVPLDPS